MTFDPDFDTSLTAIAVPRQKRRWVKAMHHFRKLIANKEDTSQVFHITNALNGTDLYKAFNRFLAHPEGRKRFEQRRYLPPLLDDRTRLRAMPAGSLAQAYCDFMDREGLTAQGLVDEFDSFLTDVEDNRTDAFKWYNARSRDTHDMQHVLTGYGRDALGETSVLAYSYQQTSGLGIQFIAYMGALEVKRWAPKGAPVLGAIREAARRGKAAENIMLYDLEDLLPRPLEDVRDMLNVSPMTVYPEVHRRMRDAGLDPYEAVGGEVPDTQALAA
ncbi:MAG: Coq4 family protein [Litorimonas sp.]